jgi:general secretion pathway protein I
MRSKGFTLIEVVIAMVILVGGVLVVNSSWSGNLLRVRKAALYNNVAFLLERKVTELEAQFTGKPIAEISDQSGDFGSDFPQYKWTFEAQPFQMPDLTPIIMSQSNSGVDQMLLTVMGQMQEFMSKSIVEGKVSLIVTTPKEPITFSVTLYFVDYTQSLSVPGGG